MSNFIRKKEENKQRRKVRTINHRRARCIRIPEFDKERYSAFLSHLTYPYQPTQVART